MPPGDVSVGVAALLFGSGARRASRRAGATVSRYETTQHARERYVMRFFNPGCTLTEARDVLARAGLTVDRQMQTRLRKSEPHTPTLTVRHEMEYRAHDDVLFVCQPFHDEVAKRKHYVVVTCLRFEEFKANADRIRVGEPIVRDGVESIERVPS